MNGFRWVCQGSLAFALAPKVSHEKTVSCAMDSVAIAEHKSSLSLNALAL
jgi:hypothetical protein